MNWSSLARKSRQERRRLPAPIAADPSDPRGLGRTLLDLALFSRDIVRRRVFHYQLEPALAILDSVRHRRGHTFTVMMSRQAGKNDLSAQLEAFLLTNYINRGGIIVKAAPTYHPRITNSILRLEIRKRLAVDSQRCEAITIRGRGCLEQTAFGQPGSQAGRDR